MPEERKPSPISLRVEGDDRKVLDALKDGGTTTEVLLQGLRTLGETHRRIEEMPLYPLEVDDPQVADVIDRATAAAVEVLQTLFEGKPQEVAGISSNFHGGLREHIEAMLTGRPRSRRTTHLALKPLLADWDSLGRIRAAESNEGYSVMRCPTRIGEDPTFFNSDRNGWVPLSRMDPGCLYTSSEVAAKDAFAWLRTRDISPREAPMKLCLLAWPQDDGPLYLTAEAA